MNSETAAELARRAGLVVLTREQADWLMDNYEFDEEGLRLLMPVQTGSGGKGEDNDVKIKHDGKEEK